MGKKNKATADQEKDKAKETKETKEKGATDAAKVDEVTGAAPAAGSESSTAPKEAPASKKRKKEKAPAEPDAEAKDEAADSETEYPACELNKFPDELVVEHSGHGKIDGRYKRLPKASRGRPCYVMPREGKKSVYLFWHKNNKWFFSFDLGASKNLAKVEGCSVEGRLDPPCEPHPHLWKVMHHEKKDKGDKSKEDAKANKNYETSLPMRVIDASLLDENAQAEIGLEPDAVRRSEKRARLETNGIAAAAKAVAGSAETNSPAAGDQPSKHVDLDDEAAAAEIAAGAADSDDESSDADSTSESDSGASSSSASASAAPGKAPVSKAAASPAPEATPAAKAPAAQAEDGQKKAAFERKLRMQLQSIKDPKQRQQKLQQVRSMLQEKADHLSSAYGLKSEDLKVLLGKLDAEFSIKPAASKAPAVQQSRPAQESREEQPKTSLRRQGQAGRFKAGRVPRITWPRKDSEWLSYTRVDNFKGLGAELWFHMPGAYVTCDQCGKVVPQSMGSLQGDVGRAQFAHSLWICNDCMSSGLHERFTLGYDR